MLIKGTINQNCWLVKHLKKLPSPRCVQCKSQFRNCPLLPYWILSIVFILFPLVILLIGKEISVPVIIGIFVVIFGFGYFTQRLIEANLKEEQVRKELEETKKILEIKSKTRTKELEELARILDEKVRARAEELQEKAKELQVKVDELERLQRLAVGRELKMIELKRKAERLKMALEECQKRLQGGQR